MKIRIRTQRLRAWHRVILVAACVCLVTALCWPQAAWAVDRSFTSAGTWGTATNWTPNGIPGAGDSIQKPDNLAISLASSRSFGDSGTTSNWSAGTMTMAAGTTLTHVAGSTFNELSLDDNDQFRGPTAAGPRATFNNEGTMNIGTSLTRLYYGIDFRNSGTFEFQTSGTRMHFLSSPAIVQKPVFTNLAGGTLRVDLPTGGSTASFDQQAAISGPFTFENFGNVDVVSGTLTFTSSFTVPSVSAGSIDEGNWRIMADANNASLNLLPQPNSSLTTIGPNAGVTLSEQGAGTASFAQLAPLTNVDGEFFVHGTATHTVDAGGVDVTGTVGGDGTITGDVNLLGGSVAPSQLNDPHGILSIGGDLTMDASSSLDIDISGTTPGVDLDQIMILGGNAFLDGVVNINQTGTDSGPFDVLSVDPGFSISGGDLISIAGGLFDSQIVADPNNPGGFIFQVFRPPLAPEPATWALFGLALSGLGTFEWRRRRAQARS